MSHPDVIYIPAPGYRADLPDDLHTAHVRHNDEVWTDSSEYVCRASSFDLAKEIARCLRRGKN